MPPWYMYLLYPFALLYGAIVSLRNRLFDKQVLKSTSFDLPVIVVGNLSFGGTGKTPMVEYLIKLLSPLFPIATLSRGYGRKTVGYLSVEKKMKSMEVGDEPLVLKYKYPHIQVTVGEDRVLAIPQLLGDQPLTRAVILDDAMQHRSLKPGMAILLTAYDQLFTRDYLLPMGSLREPANQYKRANIIVVTKCPPNLDNNERQKIKDEIKPLPTQLLVFAFERYGTAYSILNSERKPIDNNTTVYLVAAIARPHYLESHIRSHAKEVYTRYFPDHHAYTETDIEEFVTALKNITAEDKVMLITEKDAVKLIPFRDRIAKEQLPIYIQPVETDFFPKDKTIFDRELIEYVGRT
ncbi:MAG: tetraacyldisaccharide 4'-kinase [Chitinophagales bacterium]|nr:tetraacyldisaccharide 4'-kinase [Chitinophagales bacterium]